MNIVNLIKESLRFIAMFCIKNKIQILSKLNVQIRNIVLYIIK